MRGGAGVLRRLVASALAAGLAAPAIGQEPARPGRAFSTDRPDKTESPFTVPAGRVQVEAEPLGWTRDTDEGFRVTRVSAGAFNLKLGMAREADVQLIVEPYVREVREDARAGTRERVGGFGDVTLRLKRNLWGDDGGATAFALMPFVTLPTNRGDLGADRVEFGLIAPLALDLADGLGLGVMTELDVVERERGGGYAASFVNSASLGVDVTERLGAYAELWTERSTERGSRWAVTGDMGVTFLAAEDLQLDAGVNLGLTRAADDLNIFVGMSQRF